MKLKACWIIIAITFQCQITAQTLFTDSLDSFINHTLGKFKEIPGLAITVIKGDEPIFTKAYGYADVEHKIKSTPSTPYYIASVTKSYVGLLASQLAEEGVLELDKPITAYAPIKNFKDKSVFEGVTITDLLSHTSGIDNSHFTWQFSSGGQYTRTDMIRILEEEIISLHNDKSFDYTNFGYNVLDLILSEEFGESWKDLLQKKIFLPLAMNHTSAYMSDVKKKEWGIALPYIAMNDKRLPTLSKRNKNDATMQAAGGMITTIEDAQKWVIMNMNKGKINGKQLFSEEVISKAHSKITSIKPRKEVFKDDGYALGWKHAFYGKKKALYHLGGFEGYFSHISFLPEEKIGIAIFANESHFGDNVSNLIASFAYDLLFQEVKSTQEYDTQISKVDDRVTNFQKQVAEWQAILKKRKWKLTHPMKTYAGDFKNQNMGILRVRIENGTPMASLGISGFKKATPSLNKDEIRVEFKDAKGGYLQYVFYKNKAIAIVYNENVYYQE